MQCLLRFGPLGSLLVLKLFTLSLQARDEGSQCVHQTGDNSEACMCVSVRQRENEL